MNWFLLCLIKLQDNFDDDKVLKLLLSLQCPGGPGVQDDVCLARHEDGLQARAAGELRLVGAGHVTTVLTSDWCRGPSPPSPPPTASPAATAPPTGCPSTR